MWRTRGFEPPTPENLLYQQQAKLMHHTGSSTETVMQAEDLKAVRLSSDGGEVGVVSEDSFGAGHWGINELGVLGRDIQAKQPQRRKRYGVER